MSRLQHAGAVQLEDDFYNSPLYGYAEMPADLIDASVKNAFEAAARAANQGAAAVRSSRGVTGIAERQCR